MGPINIKFFVVYLPMCVMAGAGSKFELFVRTIHHALTERMHEQEEMIMSNGVHSHQRGCMSWKEISTSL